MNPVGKSAVSVFGLALVLILGVGAGRAEPPAATVELSAPSFDASATFGRLKGLVGEWQGSWEPGSVPTTVTYSLTGNGSVLVESYLVGDTTMSTLYHLDGQELMLTHYCSVGNQPRMRARSTAADGGILFELFDITNDVSGGYSERLELRVVDRDRISIAYTGSRTGRSSGVELERVR